MATQGKGNGPAISRQPEGLASEGVFDGSSPDDTLIPTDQDGTVAEKLVSDLEDMTTEEKARFLTNEIQGHRMPDDAFQRTLLPQPVTGTIDVARFLQAQDEFRKATTEFMQSRRYHPRATVDEVLHEVTQYSYAQSDFIEAQANVLKNLGVL